MSPVSRPPSSGRPPISRSARSRQASCWRSRATQAPPSLVTEWTVQTLARAIAARKISPVEATRECLDRIERLDGRIHAFITGDRSEEHTSELQSRVDLVCRLLLEK